MAKPIGGVGLFLKANENKELVIHRLAVGGSADHSGQIHPGDIVVAVDDKDVYKKEFGYCVKLIQGEISTTVKIKVWKEGNPNNPKEVWLTRTPNPEDDQSSGSNRSRSRTADIGIEFKADETGCFQITNLKQGGPADTSGQVDVGDILYEIDGVKVLYGIGPNGRPLTNIEITEMLRGPEDSILNLRLQKGRMGRLSQAQLTRKVPPYGIRSPVPAFGDRERSAQVQDLPSQPTKFFPPPPPPSDPYAGSNRPFQPPPPPPPDSDSGLNNNELSQLSSFPRNAPAVQAPPTQWPWAVPMQVQQPFQAVQPQIYQPRPLPKIELPPPPPPPAITHVAERPLPEDKASALSKYENGQYWKVYNPTRPDRFGLGIVFKPYGNGQVRIHQILKDSPAHLSEQDIEENDWLYEIDRELVYKQSLSKIMRMLHAKKQGQPVYLGLRRGGREDLIEVKIVKGNTNVPNNNCGVGIVFKSDPIIGGWVRIAQVIPGGPAEQAVKPLKGSEVMKINDRVLEVNGVDVTRQQFESWQHLLKGSEGSSCVITFADVNAELYTVHVRRNVVSQEEVDPACVSIPLPVSEAPIKAQPRALIPEKKFIAHISPVTCGISFLQKENDEVVVDHVAVGGPADRTAKFIPESKDRRIRPGDILMEIGGVDVYKQPVENWKKMIQEGAAGQNIKFKFKVPNENLTYDVLVKRTLVRKPDLSIGLNFRCKPDGTFYVYSINPKGPAFGKGIDIGDVLLEISKEKLIGNVCENGTDREMHKCDRGTFPQWKGVVGEGQKDKTVKLRLNKVGTTNTYTVDIPRKNVLFNVGIQWAAHGSSIFVDKLINLENGSPSSAEKEGVRVGYVLQAIQNVPMVGNLDALQLTMNELLLGEFESKAILTFKTADGDFTFGVARDINTNLADTNELPFKPREKVPNLGKGNVRPFQPTELIPGGGIFKQPMSNPELWSSFLDEGRPIVDQQGRGIEDKCHLFTWRGRILSQPEYSEDHSVCKVWDVGGLDNEDASRYELIYYGPGMREPRVPMLPGQYVEANTRQTPLPTHQTVQIPKTQEVPVPVAGNRIERSSAVDKAPIISAPKKEVEKPKKVMPPVVPSVPPPPPPNDPPPPPPPDIHEDDESILLLSDNTTVEAKVIEKILKEHLHAVAHVMVVGSNKKFLSCLLTLKTVGWEAAERGEDPRAVPNHLDLVGPALELAKKVGSRATTVIQARQDPDFRAKGLLPQFTAANQKITSSAQQVRRFSILPNEFTKKTGELKPDGSLDRIKIKKQYKNFIEGMYQEKKAT